jgi:excisionase family DNA binding protein
MLNRLLRGNEVAQILNISRAYAYLLMKRGQIPAVRIGRSVRVRPEDLEKFIVENTSGAGQEDVALKEAANSTRQSDTK